jgi:hypothetical protein
VACIGAYPLFFLRHSCTEPFIFVPSSFSLTSFVPSAGGKTLCARLLNSTWLCLKTVLRLRGVGVDIGAGQGVGVGQWAADGFCLRYVGMHGVPHLRGIRASIVAQVVVMGRCARGTFVSCGGDDTGEGLRLLVSTLLLPLSLSIGV